MRQQGKMRFHSSFRSIASVLEKCPASSLSNGRWPGRLSRCIVIDEGYERYGITGEIASMIATAAFYDLEAPVKRMGAMHVPIPFSPPLEDVTVPTEGTVTETARKMCKK